MSFADRLARAQQTSGSLVCVGLDPEPAKLPKDLGGGADRTLRPSPCIPSTAASSTRRRTSPPPTSRRLPSTAPSARRSSCSRASATSANARRHALVILDAKRSDIGNTAEAYAREAFDRYDADAVTVNPYMGEDSVRPFLSRPDRGAILLCRTSNPGARDFQDLPVDGMPLYRRVAERAAGHWNEHRNLMLVVGATYPREMADLRQAHPELSFLVPGIGAQGGDLDATLEAGLDAGGAGLLISSSRNIIYAGGGSAEGIRAAAAELHAAINRQRTAWPRALRVELRVALSAPRTRS